MALRTTLPAAARGPDRRAGRLQDAVHVRREDAGCICPIGREDIGHGRCEDAGMIHLWLPLLLVAVLAGAGTYGVIARRNAVLVLIGVELILNAANLLFVTMGSVRGDALRTGHVLTLFLISIAAAEVGVALAVILALFRSRGHIDLSEPGA